MTRTEPPSVFFVIHSFDVGGAQRSVMTTAAAWPSGWECGIITARGGALLDEAQRAASTRVVAPAWPRPLAIARFMLQLRSIARRERPTAFLTNSFGVARVMLLLKKLGGLGDSALVVVEHNTFSVKIAGLYRSRRVRSGVILLTRWLYRSADAIIGVSDGVSRDLEQALGLPTETVATIRNPIDVAHIQAASNAQIPAELEAAFGGLARPIVLTAGRMVAAKAQDDLLQAFALLPEHLRGSLVILGDGPLRPDLERQADALGIAHQLWMPGFVENPWWFMARADVFALTSRWEGLPMILLEALACEARVFSTDCPSGPREILEGVRSARLAPVGDPGIAAAAIGDLLTTEHSSASSSALSIYTPTAVAASYSDLIGFGSTPREERQD